MAVLVVWAHAAQIVLELVHMNARVAAVLAVLDLVPEGVNLVQILVLEDALLVVRDAILSVQVSVLGSVQDVIQLVKHHALLHVLISVTISALDARHLVKTLAVLAAQKHALVVA